jgi:hypothetical protein
MQMNAAVRLLKSSLDLMGVKVSRAPRHDAKTKHLALLYEKYKDFTMLGPVEYATNLALASTVSTPGCVIECGVWKGGSSAGMAEVLGPDRQYFLFDSYQGHVEPKPVDGPAAMAWQADKSGPWYFDNAVVGTEFADAAMKMSGAKNYQLVKGYFDDTVPGFIPPSKIAVLRIDCDWHAGTMTCLKALFPHLADDGIMIADGYEDWDGYARAIHEYLAGYEAPVRIKQFGELHYLVKGARNWQTAGPRQK